jgi:hypothetical protein
MGDWFIVKYHADGTVDVSDGDEVVMERVTRHEALERIIDHKAKSAEPPMEAQEGVE